MARTKAISLIQSGELKADLKEIYGYVVKNVQKAALSAGLKSQAYTGNPATGSVEFKRFANSTSKDYGTARAAGAGDKLKAPPITVNLNVHKEIVEEVAKFDLDTFGVGNILARRADNHVDTMAAELDVAFFNAAFAAGTAFTTSETDLEEILEAYIQTLETVKNDYVRGVNRSQMVMVCSPKFYGKIRNILDTKPNGTDTASENFGMFHGVRIYSSVNIPTGQNAVLMIDEAIAQPVVSYPYTEPEKIPLSNDFAVSCSMTTGHSVDA
ncbi:hypothetical protein [Acetivibrio straminisolvens]|uniref:Uncharacterized protein n=1 Tax=Acetivibrio straminisolvens JCM 21531 TaxID=1294263 RepID=W4V8P0_9FIRM|nr:hypothetical protein [Acetivibrio straminisolvens]GAE89521.1 hypothetical protein JCM21531_3058 [Acetivibrio straminisolvens JCM 21531]